jgi:hypothetical protein
MALILEATAAHRIGGYAALPLATAVVISVQPRISAAGWVEPAARPTHPLPLSPHMGVGSVKA